jgi:hypothetical protein
MKLLSKKREQGSILAVALFTGLAIGIVLATYLTLISSRYNLTVRSMEWNAAMPVLEAGLEEALTHLHDDPATSPTANGWTSGTISGLQVYTKERHFTDGSYFYVWIYNATAHNPRIYSQGFVPAPLGQGYISRRVVVGATNTPSVFTKAIAATGAITLPSGVVDGFNSSLGGYDTLTNRNATGNIATDSTNKPAVTVGKGGHVYGTVITGPGGTISVGSGGTVGDAPWNASNTGIEPGWTNNNMNVAFPSNQPPTGGPFPTPTVTVAGGSNITYLPTGKYQMSSFTSSGSTKPMIVTGNATLWVTGNVAVQGSGYILINPGASLTLIVGGTATVSGGGVVNGTGLASDFSLVGLSGNTQITYSGSAAFIGTINAPQAAVTISGSADFYGAMIAKTVTITGGGSVHYDDTLGTVGGLIVSSWTEL